MFELGNCCSKLDAEVGSDKEMDDWTYKGN